MQVDPARLRQDVLFRHFPVQPWLEVGKGQSEISILVKRCPEPWTSSLCSGGYMSSSRVKIWETASPKNAQLQTGNRMGMAGHVQDIHATERGGEAETSWRYMSYPSTHSLCASGFPKGREQITQGRV